MGQTRVVTKRGYAGWGGGAVDGGCVRLEISSYVGCQPARMIRAPMGVLEELRAWTWGLRASVG